MRPLRILTLAFLLFTLTAAAQTDRRIEEQKRVIAALEKRIATEEQEISKIQKGRTATEERVRRLACQIDSRNQLLDETEKQARLLRGEIARTDSVAGNLSAKLERDRAQYGEMVREAYRNYKHNNYLTYIFSSRDFTDVARKITALREVASLRERKLRDIEALTAEVRTEKETLDRRKRSLDSVTRSLSAQREKLQRDARNAKASIRSMSQKEKTALQRKIAQEQQLDVAIGELRKLTKGNTEGASFSAKTSGLRLPVTAGRVKRYKENMAEITGPKGAHVISIYDGKVVDVKRNRITNKYDVYVAHGEYITSYANMGTICVEKGQKPNIMTVLVFLTGLLCIVSLFFFSWSTYRQIISTEKDVDAVSEQITAKQSEIHEAQEKYTSAVDQAQSNIDRLKQREKNLSQNRDQGESRSLCPSSSKPSVFNEENNTSVFSDSSATSSGLGHIVGRFHPGHQSQNVDMSALEPNGPGSSELKCQTLHRHPGISTQEFLNMN